MTAAEYVPHRYDRSTVQAEEFIVRRAIDEFAYALSMTNGDLRRAVGFAEAAGESAAYTDQHGEHVADHEHLRNAMAVTNAGPGYGMQRVMFEYIRSAAEHIVASERTHV
jgi:hypothetical protein